MIRSTTYDIAERAGVNQSTVSRVLSGFPHVSPAMRQKVMDACKQMDYVPNILAKGLKSKRTYLIAVHVPFNENTVFADPFIHDFLAGVTQEAARHDYSVLLSFASAVDVSLQFNHLIRSRRADGLILTSAAFNDQRVKELIREQIPCVLGRYDRPLGKHMASVDVNNRAMGRQAAAFLCMRKHRRIGVIVEHKGYMVSDDFLTGWQEGLSPLRCTGSKKLIQHVPVTIQDGRRAAEVLLKQIPPVTAIVINNALGVFGVMEAVRASNRKIDVLGVDSPIFRGLYPNLPRICVPANQLGVQMAQVLFEILASRKSRKPRPFLQPFILDEHNRVYPDPDADLVR